MAHSETGAAFRRGDRPVSPHLQVYRLPLTAVTSILHRITGVGLALGAAMVACWFVALAGGQDTFAPVQAFWNSIIGGLLQIGFAFGLMFHLLNGVRHLFWDAGALLDVRTAARLSVAVVFGTVILTAALVGYVVY